MIVRTFTGLQTLASPPPTWSTNNHSLTYHGLNQTYAEIYRTQANVRICVDFLARNIAQLSWPVFRRISNTDRERLPDHDLARWLSRPNPSTTQYRLFEGLVADMAVYFNAYWLKVRHQAPDGRDAIGLVRLPPDEMCVHGALLPTHFVWTSNGRERTFPLSEIVYFNGYNPLNPLMGLSSMEMLRMILAEETIVNINRQAFWRNSSRMEGVWEIEKDSVAAKWNQAQQQSWREQWQEFTTGAKAGMTAIGPAGGTYKEISFSAKDSEYTQGGKLRREVCAAAFHIPQPMVGILDHATFSNIKEQHKHLYQDTLGPWLELINQEIEAQLLVECEDQNNVYIEANIDAKLAGTPEERAQSLKLAVGRPWRTVNEARALENLPRIDDPELDTVAPQQGGPAADATKSPEDTPTTAVDVAPVLQAARARQQARLHKLPEEERALAFVADLDRWNRELASDLTPLVGEDEARRLAAHANAETLSRLEDEALHG